MVQVVGLPASAVGLGLSIAGLCGFLATVPAGRLADLMGPRRPLAATHALLAMLYAGYGLIVNYASFLVIACLVGIAEAVVGPVRAALVYRLCRDERAPRVRAQMRSAYNRGFVLGASTAGLALAVGTRPALVAIGLVNGAAQAVCALVAARLPDRADPADPADPADRSGPADPSGPDGPRQRPAVSRAALRNPRFLLVTAVNGLLELHQAVLMVGVPAWLLSRTDAPVSLNAALLVLNTVAVVLFQVRVGRNAHTVAAGARLQRAAGLLLAAGCAIIALSDHQPALVAAAVLLAGTLVMAFGEMAQTAGGYVLSFELPPPGRQGEYQGVFALGKGIRQAIGPVAVTSLALGLGAPCWLLLGGLFALLGLASVPLARSAASHPPEREHP